jgi:CheY-like chemotaxis protein
MEALGLLAGGVAHDLNNVLSGIISYPELILMDLDENHSARSMVSAIQRSGQKAAAIVQDLLALARRGVNHTSILNINNDIILDYLNSPEFRKMQSYHPAVTVETQLAPDIMNIRGSAIHLKKTIMNLVSNAAEAQPDGGRIIITTKNIYVDRPISGYDEVNEGDYAMLRVKDYGAGIASEDLNRIFEPFYTKKKMGRSGTGLGMAVVWGTVQDHKGYINVKSRIDQCTIFEIYLPVTREPVKEIAETVQLDHYSGRGEKILVIDDVEEQREIASTLLKRLQYKVATVPSGEAALEYLKYHSSDLLVLDMIMDPGMDGLDTYIEILKINPDQRAIIASGYAEDERVRETQRLGAGAYIRKPYTIDKIARAVREELDR